ncbi:MULTISPECIES: thiolase family protein [unclassified Sphingopyxis]|uniref:thiolase family protein n=1 Tax=unclassified Sphingopyxis TaxID=2614943 RepID=UPI0007306E1D|nr:MULTISPECIES: thiolase family protein [unclassified Sphingopyxis]KTE26355.1 acetyl-CoA acetyltransferase [Sphingopyxis sp. H057]KTE52758.1 acetyl-CoA acetyltransferase [Sphingopyxis sp. H073]KTE54948.1 acetyl-CoA acetyltransferase [Sphingopyxis sp. H071]KTE62408.1 acetyl-CoA acetyltransferase [Sphingopyxis sp. H107]KTE65954.1 acetyl-CoA acetyltransferase [Sphingopyxis sp. H100]
MSDNVYIIGAGIHPFGRTDSRSGRDQGVYAVRQALADAGVEWGDVEFAYGGSAAAGSADIMVNELGLTSVPFINVANGCATGGSALTAAQNAIAAGACDIALAVGFDKHPRGAFNAKPSDYGLPEWYGETGMMLTTQFFALKIQRYMALHGISRRTLGLVAEKAFRNGTLCDHAWRRSPVDLDTILNAPMVNDPLTKYMFCSPAEGAVALVLASAKKVRELGADAVRIASVAFRTRPEGSFEVFAPSISVNGGGKPTEIASKAAFEMAGIGPEDVSVAQLQDTESGAEIMHMAENGFCADGEQEQWLAEGWSEIGGKLPVNTDGGCLACGEPIGASGLRQVYENTVQLRGRGGERQVPNSPKVGYSHVYGAPGLSAVAILER